LIADSIVFWLPSREASHSDSTIESISSETAKTPSPLSRARAAPVPAPLAPCLLVTATRLNR
jgi:hypothetical protein